MLNLNITAMKSSLRIILYSIIIICVIIEIGFIGYVTGGYDFTNKCWYKDRASAQTELHGLAMDMLEMYYDNDTCCFFEDVIMETDTYDKYNTLIDGDWKDFGHPKK